MTEDTVFSGYLVPKGVSHEFVFLMLLQINYKSKYIIISEVCATKWEKGKTTYQRLLLNRLAESVFIVIIDKSHYLITIT